MDQDTIITPVSQPAPTHKPRPIGRRADRLAMVLAGLGAALSLCAAIWFFAGFTENDTRPEHLASVLALTLILFAFAIIPFSLVTIFAHWAYRIGTKRAHLFWTIFLMLPWILLGSLAISHTPLPLWAGLIMVILAALLCIWALVSLVLDRRQSLVTPNKSQENEMQDTDS